MAKPTIAKLTYACGNSMTFRTTEGYDIEVIRFSDDILELELSLCTPLQMTMIVAGCFESRSTFANVKQVNFIFKGKKLSVKKEENATPPMILDKWYDTLDEE